MMQKLDMSSRNFVIMTSTSNQKNAPFHNKRSSIWVSSLAVKEYE